jgi:hypothetical protein
MGAVALERPGAKLENVVITEMATLGLSALAADQELRRVTVTSAGLLGIHARFADRLRLESVLATANNTQLFNAAPTAAGMKITQSRGVIVDSCSFSGNKSYGFWTDMSVYDVVVRSSSFSRNSAGGLFLEISAKAVVGNSVFVDNGAEGLKINNTSDVQVWNNSFSGNARPLNIVQDARRNTNSGDPAVDFRRPFPDPTMPWTLGPVTVSNNVIGQPRGGNCLLCVEDYSREMTAEAMGIAANGNLYNRRSPAEPTWLAVWSRGAQPPFVFTTLAEWSATTGQERSGREYTGPRVVSASGALTRLTAGHEASIAQPLPTPVAEVLGLPAGSQRLGAWWAPPRSAGGGLR